MTQQIQAVAVIRKVVTDLDEGIAAIQQVKDWAADKPELKVSGSISVKIEDN